MTDSDNSTNQDIDIEIALSACVLALSSNLELIGQITNKLAAKRTTLEEKMIRNSLHQLGSTIGMSVTSAHRRWLEENSSKTQPISVELLIELDKLNAQIAEVLGEFLKMANYNPNYLEQYYEYDFAAKLLYEYKFNERLLELLAESFLSKKSA